MQGFMDEYYLLETETARKLFFDYAKDMPIFDYHCHLPVQEIAADKHFDNITQVWLSGDHYKWRVMRANGIEEDYITGNKSDQEKFRKWAETVPYTLGNPLFQWTYFELRQYFGITDCLKPETADTIWNSCNELLQRPEFSAKNLIKRSNVKALCTTDDPLDTLEHHLRLKEDDNFDVKVLPTFRPDMALAVSHPDFSQWVERLGALTGITVQTFEDYLQALYRRMDDFHAAGCRLSDHSLADGFYLKATEAEVNHIYTQRLANEPLSVKQQTEFCSAVLTALGKGYAERGWAMQIHLGAMRNTNSRMLRAVGINTGFDTIGAYNFAHELSALLDELDSAGLLPKTVLYCLNPRDNELLAAMTGNFQGGIAGKIQFGSAWWFNDHRDGMEEQMRAVANIGLLSRFVGMLTDSRSFLSYPRHEYFRRIMCNLIGRWVEEGSYYRDDAFLGEIVKGICFNNIKDYLDIEV